MQPPHKEAARWKGFLVQLRIRPQVWWRRTTTCDLWPGLGFRVTGFGFRLYWDLGSGVYGSEYKAVAWSESLW